MLRGGYRPFGFDHDGAAVAHGYEVGAGSEGLAGPVGQFDGVWPADVEDVVAALWEQFDCGFHAVGVAARRPGARLAF
jgi:hypothetical protein